MILALRIRTAGGISTPGLRDALVGNLADIAPDCRLLEAALPYAGAPLLLEAGERPMLLSYDAENGARALLAGLAATERLRADAGWLARLHPSIPAANWGAPATLVVVAPSLPPGAGLIRLPMPLRLFTFRALQVNGDTGILLETVGDSMSTPSDPPPDSTAPAPVKPPSSRPDAKLGLSAAESAFFADLLES